MGTNVMWSILLWLESKNNLSWKEPTRIIKVQLVEKKKNKPKTPLQGYHCPGTMLECASWHPFSQCLLMQGLAQRSITSLLSSGAAMVSRKIICFLTGTWAVLDQLACVLCFYRCSWFKQKALCNHKSLIANFLGPSLPKFSRTSSTKCHRGCMCLLPLCPSLLQGRLGRFRNLH